MNSRIIWVGLQKFFIFFNFFVCHCFFMDRRDIPFKLDGDAMLGCCLWFGFFFPAAKVIARKKQHDRE